MQNVFLFTGENLFQIGEEKRRWVTEFMAKHGGENITRLDGSRMSVRDLLDEVAVMPFLSPKRLVVVEGLPKASKEEIAALLPQVHPQCVVLFVEPKIDKRLAGSKELLGSVTVKEFPLLKGKSLLLWMRQAAEKHRVDMEGEAMDLLIEYVGDDQEAILREIEKFALSHSGTTVSLRDIEETVIPTEEGVVWRITDLLSAGKREEALRFARRMLERGGDAYGLWAVLLSFLKNIVLVHAAVTDGEKDAKVISEKTGIHFFAVRGILPYARKQKTSVIRQAVAKALETDRSLKTGLLKATDEAPQEILAAIDAFLLAAP